MGEHLKYSELSGGKKRKRQKTRRKRKGGNALVTYGTPALTYGMLSLLKKECQEK